MSTMSPSRELDPRFSSDDPAVPAWENGEEILREKVLAFGTGTRYRQAGWRF